MNTKARGGTELMAARVDRVLEELGSADRVNVIHSRYEEGMIDPDKWNVLVCHDLAQDPMYDHLRNGGWKKFDHIVFVSHWQQSQFATVLGVPYIAGGVINNAIEPIPAHTKPTDKIRFIYTSTPHRGLDLLYVAFNALAAKYGSILELEVYSSFDLYGWEQRDEMFSELFQRLEAHPQIKYSKSVDNEVIRERLQQSHFWVLPSKWPETSCLALIEAMSAGCICIHSSLGALPETSRAVTCMYGFTEDNDEHASILYHTLDKMISEIAYDDTYYDNEVTWVTDPNSVLHKITAYNHSLVYLKEKWEQLIDSLEGNTDYGDESDEESDEEESKLT